VIGRRVSLLWLLALAGCRWLPRAPVAPMPVLRLPLQRDARAPLLVVMLPGVYNLPADFVDEGFVAALHSRGFAADVWIADSHRGYADNGTLFERLRDDVIAPAQRAGYRRLWLVGISLGGFASLGLLRQQPQAIEGVLAIAPYVGRPAVVQQVTAAGGAQAYARSATDDAVDSALWSWFGQAPDAVRDKVHLYTGSDDRFIAEQRLFAQRLAPDHVLEVPGDHDWPAWRALWQRWLERAPWPRRAA
jgi:pimeloyl-ACP methyl ester carboxylesterase